MEYSLVWDETRDLLNQVKTHPVGSAIFSGTPPRIWYAAWTKALFEIYTTIDKYSDPRLTRDYKLYEDYSGFEYEFILEHLHNVQFYISLLNDPNKIDGAICVLSEYSLIQGEEILSKLDTNLPSAHLQWFDRIGSLECLNTYMDREDLVESAKLCYTFILAILSEIETKYPI